MTGNNGTMSGSTVNLHHHHHHQQSGVMTTLTGHLNHHHHQQQEPSSPPYGAMIGMPGKMYHHQQMTESNSPVHHDIIKTEHITGNTLHGALQILDEIFLKL